LGLAVVKAIVEGYGGTVAAANRPSGGAVVTIALPIAATAEGKYRGRLWQE